MSRRSLFLVPRCCRLYVCFAISATLISARASGQLTLDGLTLVEEGPYAAMAGDPVPANLATGATPFASSDLGPEIGTPYHFTENLNDGFYGNAFSWIGGDQNPFPEAFAGIDLGPTPVANVQSIAFGRSNVLAGDICGGGGVCMDRHMGFYILQYTQVPRPSQDLDLETTGNALTGWVDVGTLDYGTSDGENTRYNRTWARHRYNFSPVSATGVRMVVPGTGLGGGTAIDEIELYNVPGPLVDPPDEPPLVIITPAQGFNITWDGNEGEFFNDSEPPGGSLVPDNAALASRGSVPFASSDLGPQLGITFHVTENLNDGFYGNSNSWIGGDDNPFAPEVFAGVALSQELEITSVAWGRDNGNNVTDACGGQCMDRSTGRYTLQFTQVANPNADTKNTGDAATGWQSIGDVTYMAGGGDLTPYLRHEFAVSQDGRGVRATGFRLLVPNTGLGSGTAVDEIEIYGRVALRCDLNGDGNCNVQDIDLLTQKVIAGQPDRAFDLNQDGRLDAADRRVWVADLVRTWFGDANLDSEFNSSDLVRVFQAGKYETGQSASWSEGDWDGDGRSGSGDLVTAFQDGGFERGPRQGAAAAVPEPSVAVLLILSLPLVPWMATPRSSLQKRPPHQ